MAGKVFEVMFRVNGELSKNFGAAMGAAIKNMSALTAASKAMGAASAAGADKLAQRLDKLNQMAQKVQGFSQLRNDLSATQQAMVQAGRQAQQLQQPYLQNQRLVDALARNFEQLAQAYKAQEKAASNAKANVNSIKAERAQIKIALGEVNAKIASERAAGKKTPSEDLIARRDSLKRADATLKANLDAALKVSAEASKKSAELKRDVAAAKVDLRVASALRDNSYSAYSKAVVKGNDLKLAVDEKRARLMQTAAELKASGFDTTKWATSEKALNAKIKTTNQAILQRTRAFQAEKEMLGKLQARSKELQAQAKLNESTDLKVRKAKVSDEVLGVVNQFKMRQAQTAANNIAQPLSAAQIIAKRIQRQAESLQSIQWKVARQGRIASSLPNAKSLTVKPIDAKDPLERLGQIKARANDFVQLSNSIARLKQETLAAHATTVKLGISYTKQQETAAKFKAQLDQLRASYKANEKDLSTQQAEKFANRIKEMSAVYDGAMKSLKSTSSALEVSKSQWRVMNTSLGSQLSALQRLKAALSNAGFNVSSFAESEARLRAEVEATTRALEAQARASVSRTRLDESLTRYSDAYNDFQNVLSSAQTVMSPFAASVETAKDFEKQMSVVKALTQMDNLREGNLERVNAEMAELTDQAKHLNLTTQFTALQAAQGQTYLAYAGWDKDQIVQAMPHMMDLASAAGMTDLGRASDILTDIMSAFKLPVDQAGHVADVLAYTFTHSNQNLEQLYDTMKYAAPVARLFGSSIEEAAAITKFMADAGVKGSMAGTSMRQTMLRLVAPPKTATKAMEEAGITVDDATKEWANANALAQEYGIELNEGLSASKQMASVIRQINTKMGGMSAHEKLSIFKAITGVYAVSGATNLFETGGELVDDKENPGQKITRLESFTRDLENSDGAAAQTAEVMLDNYAGAMTLLESAITGVKMEIGTVLTPTLKEAAQAVTPLVQSFAQWIAANPRIVQGAAAVAAGLSGVVVAGAGVKLLAAGFDVVSAGLGVMRNGAVEAAGRFSRLAAGLTPVTVRLASLGTRIAGLGAALRGLTLAGAFNGLAGLGQRIIAGMMRIGAAVSKVGSAFMMAGRAMLAFAFSPAGAALIALAATAYLVYRNWDKLAPVFERLANVLGGALSAAFDTLQPSISAAMDSFGHLKEVLSDSGAGDMLVKAFIVATSTVTGLLAGLVKFTASAVAAMASLFGGLADVIANVLEGNFSKASVAANKMVTDTAKYTFEATKNLIDIPGEVADVTRKSLEIYEQMPQILKERERLKQQEETLKAIREETTAHQKAYYEARGMTLEEGYAEIAKKRAAKKREDEAKAAGFTSVEEYTASENEKAQRIAQAKLETAKNYEQWLIDNGRAIINEKTGKVTDRYELFGEPYDNKNPFKNSAGIKRHALDAKTQQAIQAAPKVEPAELPESVEPAKLPYVPAKVPESDWARQGVPPKYTASYQPPQVSDRYDKSVEVAQNLSETTANLRAATQSTELKFAASNYAAKVPGYVPSFSTKEIAPPARSENTSVLKALRETFLPSPERIVPKSPVKQAETPQPVVQTPIPPSAPIAPPPQFTVEDVIRQANEAAKITQPAQPAQGGALEAALSSVFSPLVAMLNLSTSTAAASTLETASTNNLPQMLDTAAVQVQLNALGNAANANAQSFAQANSQAESTTHSLAEILNSTTAFGEQLSTMTASTVTANANMSAMQAVSMSGAESLSEVQASAQSTANSLEQTSSSISNVNETFSQATQAVSESVSTASQAFAESLAAASTSITETFTSIMTSAQSLTETFAQINSQSQQLTANITSNVAAVQQSTSTFASNSAAVMSNSSAAQMAAASLSTFAGVVQASGGEISALASSSSSAAGSVSALGSAAANAVATMQVAASSIASAAANIGTPAQNYSGGIYNKGAFLTWFAEKSPEAAIPLDGSDRAISLWAQAGNMLGVYPYANSESITSYDSSPSLIAAENYNGGIYAPGGRSIERHSTYRNPNLHVTNSVGSSFGGYNFEEFNQGAANLFKAAANLSSATSGLASTATAFDSVAVSNRISSDESSKAESHKNFIEKGVEAASNYFYKIFHPRKNAIKKRGYETDELGNIIGLNGLEDNVITGRETIATQRDKREAQIRAFEEMQKLPTPPPVISEKAAFLEIPEPAPIVSERAARLEVPNPPPPPMSTPARVPSALPEILKPTPTFPASEQSKLPDILKPTPTFPAPELSKLPDIFSPILHFAPEQPPSPNILEQIFTPSSVKSQRQVQQKLDKSRNIKLGDNVKNGKSYRVLTNERRNTHNAMTAPQQWDGRGLVDNIERGNWIGAINTAGKMYERRNEIKAADSIVNPINPGDTVDNSKQIVSDANTAQTQIAQTSATAQTKIAATNKSSKNFIQKGIEAASNYFYKIFHPRKNAAKQLDYETDELGNIVGLNGLEDNVITGGETKRVRKDKQQAQFREYIQKRRARTDDEPRDAQIVNRKSGGKNFVEKTFEAAGNIFSKRNAFLDWDVTKGLDDNLGRVVYNMFGGDQTGVHPSPFGNILGGGLTGAVSNIVSPQSKRGNLLEQIFTPSSVKSQRAVQQSLDYSRSVRLGDNVKNSKSYQALTGARRPSRASTAMTAPRQWDGVGFIQQIRSGNWKGGLGTLGTMYGRKLEIGDYQNPAGAPYTSTFPTPKSSRLPVPILHQNSAVKQATNSAATYVSPGAQSAQLEHLNAVNNTDTVNNTGTFNNLSSEARNTSNSSDSLSMPAVNLNFTITIQGNASRDEVEAGVKQAVPYIQESFEEQYRKFKQQATRRAFF